MSPARPRLPKKLWGQIGLPKVQTIESLGPSLPGLCTPESPVVTSSPPHDIALTSGSSFLPIPSPPESSARSLNSRGRSLPSNK